MITNKMKFFVTGGAGFIGSVLVNKLINNGHHVTVFDNFSLGKRKFLQKHPKLSVIKGDVLNYTLLEKSIKSHDFVFHFAANSDISAGTSDTKLDFDVNTVGTLNVLNAMKKHKISNIVFASSSAIFGFPSKFPTPEDYGPCLPESLYGASKLASEGFISAFSNLYKIRAWIFRFANITGSPATHGILFDFVKKLQSNSKTFEVLGNGKQEKSYITNEMLIDGILQIVQKTNKQKQNLFLFNIGNDDMIKVKDISKLFLKLNNSNKKIKYTGGKSGWKGDIHKMNLDVTQIKKVGWKPNQNSRKCIVDSINDLRKQI